MSISQYIADTYGSKRGLARYIKFNALASLGAYRHAKGNHVQHTQRLIYICSGNICRSPFGEFVAHKADFPAISFGLHCRGGDPAFAKTLDYAQRHNYALDSHRSTNMQDYEPEDGDLLIVMEPAHLAELDALYPNQNKVLIGLYAKPKTVYLHDPYNTNQVFFDKCMAQIEQATQALIKQIQK